MDAGRRRGRLGGGGDREVLADGVVEQFPRDPFGGGAVEIALDEVDLGGLDVFDAGEAGLPEAVQGGAGGGVGVPRLRRHVHAPDHGLVATP